MTIKDQLVHLVGLQSAELEQRRIERELAALPGEREALAARIGDAEEGVEAARHQGEEAAKDRRRLEGELQNAEARIDKYRDQEMQVRRNEELWALQGEMRTVQDKIEGLEVQILEEMERADTALASVREREGALGEVRREVELQLREIDDRQRELEAERNETIGRIRELRAAIPEELLATYDRIRSVRKGLGIAAMADGGCTACQVRQRPQLALEVQKMEEVRQCDNCKRILFSRDALQVPSDVQVGAD